MSSIKMVGYRLLIEPYEVEKQTKSGIVIVVDEKLEQAAMQYGVVVSIGPYAWKTADGIWEPWVEVGDHIMFAKHSGRLVKDEVDGKLYMYINDTDVLAKVPPKNKEA